jgi:hypothetical protein
VKRPPDFSKSTDAIEFALNIINRKENRERDREWGPLVAQAEADLDRIARRLPPQTKRSIASPALALVVNGDGVQFEYARENNLDVLHRVLLHNAVLLVWNDDRRRKGLFKRCALDSCKMFLFARRKTLVYCSDQCRMSVHNPQRGPKRRKQDRDNYRIKNRYNPRRRK